LLGALSAELTLSLEETRSETRPSSPEILSPSTTDTASPIQVGECDAGLVDSRGVAIQKAGKKGGLRVTFIKDRTFKNKPAKGKNIKAAAFRSTKMRGTTAAKKLTANKRALARLSAVHRATSRSERPATKKAAAPVAK